jgi:hypothetical protein
MAQVVECLPGKCKAPSPNVSMAKKTIIKINYHLFKEVIITFLMHSGHRTGLEKADMG